MLIICKWESCDHNTGGKFCGLEEITVELIEIEKDKWLPVCVMGIES